MELLIPAVVLAVFAYVGVPFLYLRLLKWRLRRRSGQAWSDMRLRPKSLCAMTRTGSQASSHAVS